MTAYLENVLTLPEYQEAKNKLVVEKQRPERQIDVLGTSFSKSVRTSHKFPKRLQGSQYFGKQH